MKQFSCSMLDRLQGRDVWHNKVISYDEAKSILIFNGWTEKQAIADLSRCPEEWILVNSSTQIC